MLKYIEEVLFAPKSFAHAQQIEAKQGDQQGGNGISSSRLSATKEIPEDCRLQLYMVAILTRFGLLC